MGSKRQIIKRNGKRQVIKRSEVNKVIMASECQVSKIGNSINKADT